MRHALSVLVCAVILLLAGCGDERGERQPGEPPWPVKGAPDVLVALAEDLAAYQAAIKRPPDQLAQLDTSGFATAGPYAKYQFAYSPAGLGVLQDGWRVVVADDRMRDANLVWCVVRPPVRLSASPALRVAQVPIGELRVAAAAANGIR